MTKEQIPNQTPEQIPLKHYVDRIMKVFEKEFPELHEKLLAEVGDDVWDDFRRLNSMVRDKVENSSELQKIKEEIDDWQQRSEPEDTTFN